MEVLSVSCNDYTGASIKHLHKDTKSKENIWWDAEVVDVDMDIDDMDNPDFLIIFKDFQMTSQTLLKFMKVTIFWIGW